MNASGRDWRRKPNPEPAALRDSLRRLTAELGLTDLDVYEDLNRVWEEVVGSAVAGHASPATLRDGMLTVMADTPQWATQVRFLATEVVEGLTARGVPVRELQVKVGRGRS